VNRREFITLLGGAAAAWPVGAHAQQGERVRRVGILLPGREEDDQEYQARLAALVRALHDSGWIEGHNVQFVIRRPKPMAADIRKHIAELLAVTPDIIVTSGGTALPLLLQATRLVPIVFMSVVDPGWRRLCSESFASRGQHNWLHAVRIQLER
jgi:putative ABC transport system substrate-binding protein